MKNFDYWNKLKINHDNKDRTKNPVYMKEREIWWLSFGLNIGDEEDGKGALFERPVLIVKKFNNNLFWGVALSTKIKDKNPFYVKINLSTGPQSAIISQLRIYDTKRLDNKIETLNTDDFKKVKTAIKELL